MLNYEVCNKMEATTESILKKIDKAYTDINPKNDMRKLKVESREHGTGNNQNFI